MLKVIRETLLRRESSIIDEVENICKERALKLFKLSSKKWHANVQPLSGSPANLAVYTALVPRGGKIVGMSLDHGGHLTHGHKVSATGIFWEQVPYGVDKKRKCWIMMSSRASQRRKSRILLSRALRRIRAKLIGKISRNRKRRGRVSDGGYVAYRRACRGWRVSFAVPIRRYRDDNDAQNTPRSAWRYYFCEKKDARELDKKIDKAVFPDCRAGRI